MPKGNGTRIQTMGVDSCATIAIAGWSSSARELNEAYKKDGSFDIPNSGMSLVDFYEEIIFPTAQDLGHTYNYPFTLLMEELEKGELRTKFCIAALNAEQVMDGYWVEELSKWGFKKIDETNNTLGLVNHIYLRSPNRPKKYKLGQDYYTEATND